MIRLQLLWLMMGSSTKDWLKVLLKYKRKKSVYKILLKYVSIIAEKL